MNAPSFILLPDARGATDIASAIEAEAFREDATTLLAHAASDAAVTVGHLTGTVVGALTAPFAMAAAAMGAAPRFPQMSPSERDPSALIGVNTVWR